MTWADVMLFVPLLVIMLLVSAAFRLFGLTPVSFESNLVMAAMCTVVNAIGRRA